MDVRTIIRTEYGNGKNFMTPTVLDVGWVDKGTMVYELSKGEGMVRPGSGVYPPPDIFGVTIVSYDPSTKTTKREYELSRMFNHREKAWNYINELQS